MGLTHDETNLFALLWMKASADQVLEQRDADLVSRKAMDAAEALLKPCARYRALPFKSESNEPAKYRVERHSSWVH